MPSSGSKSPSPHRNRKKSNSADRKKGSRDNRSPSSSSRSSHSSRDRRRSNPRRSRSNGGDKPKEYGRYPPRRDIQPVPQSTKLFVTNIDSKVFQRKSKFTQEELDRDIRALFQPFGKLKDVVIKTKQGSANSYLFVEFEEIEAAVKALETLRGRDFKGKELKVQYGRGERKNDDRKSDKCYICHKEGHFAKDCKYNKFNQNYRKDRSPERAQRYGRDRYDDDRYRRRRRDSRSRSPSSSDSRSYKRRRDDRDRDDYRRRDTRRSPQRRSDYRRH